MRTSDFARLRVSSLHFRSANGVGCLVDLNFISGRPGWAPYAKLSYPHALLPCLATANMQTVHVHMAHAFCSAHSSHAADSRVLDSDHVSEQCCTSFQKMFRAKFRLVTVVVCEDERSATLVSRSVSKVLANDATCSSTTTEAKTALSRTQVVHRKKCQRLLIGPPCSEQQVVAQARRYICIF